MQRMFLHVQAEDAIHRPERGSLATQEQELSKLGKGLPKGIKDTLIKRSRMWQAHLHKIPDFVGTGSGIWWEWQPDGSVEFFDGPDEPTERRQGPSLSHFRSSSIEKIKEQLNSKWERCMQANTCMPDLPAYKLRDEEGKLILNRLKETDPNEPLPPTFCNLRGKVD